MILPWPQISTHIIALWLVLPRASTATEINRASNESLFWGPYRPNVYFGVRPKVPKSLSMGIMWSAVESSSSPQNTFRHTCEQNEGMAGYGWDEYDVRTGGKHTVRDVQNHLDLTTQFVKVPGGEHGGNWGVRINGRLRDDAPPNMASTIVIYAGMEGSGLIQPGNAYEELGYKDTVELNGASEELGGFKMEITKGPSLNGHPISTHRSYRSRPLDRTMVKSHRVADHAVWQAKAILFQELQQSLESYTEEYGQENLPHPSQVFTIGTNEPQLGNFHLVQKVFRGNFQFDILYSSTSSPEPMTSQELGNSLKTSASTFSERFSNVFKAAAPFDKPIYDAFSKSLFSNLIGGIGYFHGEQVIDKSYASEYDEENEGFWEEAAEARERQQASLEGPFELYTSIPSRPFFPRGFLWDEGFHLIPVLDWDVGLTLEILRSWFGTMDEDGWIPREQILGLEARSKVPAEFQIQYPHYANPPTLFLIFENLVDKITTNKLNADEKKAATTSLESLYPLLKRHYLWYRRTQKGEISSYDRVAFSNKEAYRWRGRTPAHILTSGLDDYPRAQPPHPGELHVDLISWMGMMTRSIKKIANLVQENDDATQFAGFESAIAHNIDDLHWDSKTKMYCDATIDDYEDDVKVCHAGYISLFPFMTGMLGPDSPRLGAVLELIADPDQLWSEHGIRSLSQKDDLYGTAENYWRSPVWININYLILQNLLSVAQAKGPQQKRATDLYDKLRVNLVETVYKSWKDTGFAWEQYNPDTGAGQRTQHFTGWTSLVVKIMTMPQLGTSIRDEL